MQIIFLGFFVRVLLVIINFFFFPIPGGEYDTMKFYEEAILYKRYLSGDIEQYDYQIGWIYSNFLGIIFLIFGDSAILGSITSCLVWFFSAIIFRHILIELKCKKKSILIALISYSFIFPLSVIYTTFLLREVYILFFFNLLVFIILKIKNEIYLKKKIRNIIFFLLISILFIFFHRSNLVFYVTFTALMISYLFLKIYYKSLININGLIIIIAFFSFLFFINFYNKVFDVIHLYQIGHFDPQGPFRADYYTYEEFSNYKYSFLGLYKLVIKNIFNYFIQPSFIRVITFADMVALCENIIRIFLILIVLIRFIRKFENKKIYTLILFSFLLMELIYAQATVNWGSASRHHVPVTGLILLMVFFPIKKIK